MTRSIYDACGGCRNGQLARCYAPCDCADVGHVMVGDRERGPVAPSPAVTTIPRMKDATSFLVFLVFLRGLLPDCDTSLTLGDNGLTVTISNRSTGRWYGYVLDAADLEKSIDALSRELVKIHEQRSHGDDKRPALHDRHADHDLRITNSERFVIREMLSVAYIHGTGGTAGYFVRKCEKNGIDRGSALALADAFDITVPELLWQQYAQAETAPKMRPARYNREVVSFEFDAPAQTVIDLASTIEVMAKSHGPHTISDIQEGNDADATRETIAAHLDKLVAANVAIAVGDGTWCLTEHGEVIARWEGCLPLARRIVAEKASKDAANKDEPVTAEEGSAQASVKEQREKAWADLVASQCAFLLAYGWTSHGVTWRYPGNSTSARSQWLLGEAVTEQFRRINNGMDPAPSKS